jgi:SAM-dependent methyltransferase
MHEILDRLPPGSRVLDLGSQGGSFNASDYPELVSIAVDIISPSDSFSLRPRGPFHFVRADASFLPFGSRTFDAIVLNHSLEHFERLKPALQEIGRVVRPDGAIYVAVPDAATFSDRLYRKVFRGRGGHVNLFASGPELAETLSWYFGLPLVGSRTLCASLTFLNRKARDPGPGSRRIPFSRLPEPLLLCLTALLRVADCRFGTRLSVYGWALYFGNLKQRVESTVRPNICVRCGQAHPADWLLRIGAAQRRRWLLPRYKCPACGASNFFTPDQLSPDQFTEDHDPPTAA